MRWLLVFFVITICYSCGTIKYLDEGESLLVENQIIIESQERIRNKYNLTGELELIPRLKPNRNFIGIPRHWFYYKTNEADDTTRLKRFIRNNIAEAPAIYDSLLVEESSAIMERYLYNKGYFNAQVNFNTRIINKRAQVIYEVDPKRRYEVDSLQYISKDTNLLFLANNIKDQSLLSPGSPIDNSLYSKEQQRLYNYFQNRGYAGFFPSHIGPLLIDSSGGINKVTIEILMPADSIPHTKYYVGDVYVYQDYDPGKGPVFDMEEEKNDITYRAPGEEFSIKPQRLQRRIFLKPGDVYSKRKLEASYTGLRAMNNFKFVNIFPQVDSTNSEVLNHVIYLTPDAKEVRDFSADFNYATIDNQAQQLLGFSVSPKLLYRNILGGGENLDLNLEAGVELNLSNLRDPTSLRFRFQSGLDLQKFVDHLGMFRTVSKINNKGYSILSEEFYRDFKARADTRVEIAYEFNQFIELYKYHLMQLGLVTNFQKSRTSSYVYSPMGIEMYFPSITPSFREINAANPNFIAEFEENRILTGLLLRNVNYLYKTQSTTRNFNYLVNINGEISGFEIFALNSLSNLITQKSDVWRIGDVDFSKFVRLELDHRQYYNVGAASQIALRFFAGAAIPYGSGSVVPYIKQFTAGGGLSMRAWRARELGPGGDPFILGVDPTRNFFQTGDIKLEMNIEYRFPMYWIFNGALFVDAGNVWNLKEKEQSPEGHFDIDFLDEIAIGSGFGVRMDLTLFLLRLDWSYKIRSPFKVPEEGNKKWIFDSIQDLSFRKGTLQFGIDYPF